jgi:hypothetical protein
MEKRMSEDAIAVKNGRQTEAPTMSEQEYRELCKKLRHAQMAKAKKRKSRGVLRSAGTLKEVTFTGRIAESSTDWEAVDTGTVFSTDVSGAQLFLKTGKFQCRNLRTGKGRSLEGASVYVIYL